MKAILDTNVWISGFFFGGHVAQILDSWKEGSFRVVFSEETFCELKEKFLSWGANFEMEEEVAEYIYLIGEVAEFAHPEKKVNLCEDPDDNKFLEAASSGKVDYLVSGDKKIQKIGKIGDTKIVSPKKFISLLARI